MPTDSTAQDGLLNKVRDAYSQASDNPDGSHPFPIGYDFALSIGYPEELLESLPRTSVDGFTGVSNVSVFAEILAGSTVLDLGCGGGTDSLVAAKKAGPAGKVYGVDFSAAMLTRARAGAKMACASNVEFHEADGQGIPFDDATFDVVMVNGIFNLNPDRVGIFQELARVLRSGGVFYGGEIILSEPMDEEERAGLSNWFS